VLNTINHCPYSTVVLVSHCCTRTHFTKSQLEFTVMQYLYSSKMNLNLNPTQMTFDYCNVVLYGTSTAVTRRLQVGLNAAARMVVGIGKYEHITPVLRDTLHWLPVTAKIQFKIAALTFDCVRGTGPVYLKQVICPVSDLARQSLRSAGRGDLFVSRANTSIGHRSFSIAAPVVWNALPLDLCSSHISHRQFRSKLKT